MVFKLTYYLKIEPNHYYEILGVLHNSNFTISTLREGSAPIEPNPNEIICSKIVPNNQMHKALEFVTVFQSLPGVQTVIPMSEHRRTWKDLLPISASTGVTFLVTLNAIYQLVESPTPWELFMVIGIPTIVTFLSQVLYKFLKTD